MRFAIVTLFMLGLGFILGAEEKGGETTIQIPCATWFPGDLSSTEAIVVGQIAKVTEAVSPIDEKSKLFRFTLSVAAVSGDCPELKGVTELHSENPHPMEVGAWVIMLVHYYEAKPNLATGSRPLIRISGTDDPLAKLFAARGPGLLEYTEGEMLLLEKRLPEDHESAKSYRLWHREQVGEGGATARIP